MGNTYQVNYTMPVSFRLKGSHADLYLLLRSRQPVSYSAFIKDGNLSVLSLSPELFFLRNGAFIKSMPMKGTIGRGRNLKEDIRLARWLKEDAKNRAENVMIVDLIRNDLGRCSETGSIHVPELFTIERYETLFQITSTVEGRLRPGISWKDIFRSIFPCGSVTGTPKIRTMEIISELEPHPRDVYTGAIGFIGPDNQAAFNVAIRTVTLDKNQGVINVGSGITIDSDPDEEFEECILKGKFFLTEAGKTQGFSSEFLLIETICWDKSAGYHLLERHLKRLKDSAHYFSFRLDMEVLKGRLKKLEKRLFQEGKRKRVRLLLSRNGEISLSDSPVTPVSTHLFSVSPDRVFSQDIFLFHKTTMRPLYDKYRREAEKAGLFDIIFMNERDEITEGTISNIFILSEGVLWTPPVECGLLDGTLRQELVEKGEARERIIFLHDLKKAEKIFLGNSVKGLVEVRPAF
jgi:para-aminobenzoate synthetase/4-amino-4-deoxychorismate lyase